MLLLIALLVLAGSGAPITLAASRSMHLSLTPARFLFALVVALACSVATATAAFALLARTGCTSGVPCDSSGPFEGGVLLVGLWFMGYLTAYLGAAFVIARLQRQLLTQVG